ncbi:MAG: cytosine permease [Hornefia sp.]|nr:cytosine permease [Hornefia sp.]
MSERKVEANALTPKTQDERQSWISLAFVQAGICVCVPSFLEGALLAEAMPFRQAIAAGIVGNVIVVILMSILGFIGSDLGRASCTLAESTFGTKGARYIISVVYAINLIGWFGINNEECGMAFSNFMESAFGISIPYQFSSIGWGIIMLVTAVFGMSAIEKLNYISVPLLVIVMFAGTVMATKTYGFSSLNNEVEQTMSFAAGVGLAFDFYAVGVITAADVTRFQKSRKDTVKSTLVGVLPMAVVNLTLGAMLAKMSGDYNISSVLITVGLPLMGVLSLVLSTWTTNVSNAYCAGLNLVMTFNTPDNRRREVTLICGIIGIALGVVGVLGRIQDVLDLLAYLVCPVGGVMLADYFIIGKGKPENWHSVKGWNPVGVISWVISVFFCYLLKIDYMGILFSAILYLILERFIPSQSRPGNKGKSDAEGLGKEEGDISK